MKRKIINALLIAAISAGSMMTIACDGKVIYQAGTRFLYSTNGGVNWSETIQEVAVNETYYLAIEMQVVQSKETKKEVVVKADITIPNTNVLDCYLDDHPGISITGIPDPIKNSITYKFDVVASVSPAKFRVVFECTPLSAGKASIYVVYDDKVSSSWDATGTIKYVEVEDEPEDLESSESENSSEESEELSE